MSWSDLPDDILESIAKFLDSYYTVVRIRSVCSSWRSAIPLPKKIFPLELPFPNEENPGTFKLNTRAIYSIRPTDQMSVTKSSSSSEKQNGWIVCVEETKPGRVSVLDPFGGGIKQPPPPKFYENLNLLDFQISELTGFVTCPPSCPFTKIVLSWKPLSNSHDYALLAINEQRFLNYMKVGDTHWSEIPDLQDDDVIDHNGKFYLVDHKKGKAMSLNYSLQILENLQFPSCENWNSSLNLVVSCGDLYVIHNHYRCGHNNTEINNCYIPFEFSVYKLDDNEKGFKKANSLGSKAFVVLHQENCCYPISVEEFNGFKRDCVYFIDRASFSFFVPQSRISETGILLRRSRRYLRPKTCCNSYRFRRMLRRDFGIHVFNVKDGSLKQL